jgi:hypothetical protein
MGLILFYTYLMSRSLWIPMLIHCLNNSLSVLMGTLSEEWEEALQPLDTPSSSSRVWLVFAAAGWLLVSVGWALYSSRARLVRIDGSQEPPWQPPFAGVAYPPPGSGTAVSHPLPGLLPTLAVLAGVLAFGLALVWALWPSLLGLSP